MVRRGLKPLSPHPGFPLGGSGGMCVGDEGFMIDPRVYPEERAKRFADVPRTLPRRPGNFREWNEACQGGEPPGSHFPVAGLLTEFVVLGNIAIRTRKQLEWDGAAGRFTNDEAATLVQAGDVAPWSAFATGRINRYNRGKSCDHQRWKGDATWIDGNSRRGCC